MYLAIERLRPNGGSFFINKKTSIVTMNFFSSQRRRLLFETTYSAISIF
ncbi:hypothetical protein N507_1866 [Lacticaseibacillus rhamnosus DSM 14870]|nr:hypothetical protein N507_1866 [Lacticaseibacillus rhamnosus DSM 14870]